ncbi:MAG: carbon-nitrogen hydrolase family protein [Candidatus Thermoplasmatota archaeon]|nr:carbon-nitrogen hydrolase family protein [Candidatus Thermoplasmatota archaeon]MCL5963971.1 carbon-nitrogen hydrolase family protein [Candidatus Thermoplasmatota archaeon]
MFDKEKNIKTIEDCLLNNDADLFIFSEQFINGYLIGDEVFRYAEDINGRSIAHLSRISEDTGKAIITGITIEECRGVIYNSSIFIDGTNMVIQKKRNLPNFGPFSEKRYFKAGSESIVFLYKGYNIGMEICYDAFFPELSNELAIKGADIIVNISASPITSRSSFEKVLPAISAANGIYTIYVNMHGYERWAFFWGGSRVIDPKGNALLKLENIDEGICTIDIEEVRKARIGRPTIRDKINHIPEY